MQNYNQIDREIIIKFVNCDLWRLSVRALKCTKGIHYIPIPLDFAIQFCQSYKYDDRNVKKFLHFFGNYLPTQNYIDFVRMLDVLANPYIEKMWERFTNFVIRLSVFDKATKHEKKLIYLYLAECDKLIKHHNNSYCLLRNPRDLFEAAYRLISLLSINFKKINKDIKHTLQCMHYTWDKFLMFENFIK